MTQNMYHHPKPYQFVSKNLPSLLLVCAVITIFKLHNQVDGFHLSFGHRLIKSASNPQLNPASTLIRPIECRNANNHTEVGICMFSIDCMQNKGVPLSVCKHNYFVGTCCRLPDYNNFVGIVYDLRDTEANQLLEARKGLLAPLGLHSASGVASASPPLPASSLSEQPSPSPSSAPIQYSSTSTTSGPSASAGAATSGAVSREEEERIEARYIISSTSLFPSAPTKQPVVILKGQEQQPVADPKHPITTIRGTNAVQSTLTTVGESARNVDGVAQTLLVSSNNPLGQHKQQIVVPSELDSYHVSNQSVPSSLAPPSFDMVSGGPHTSNGGTYELIRGDSTTVAVDKSPSEQLSSSVMASGSTPNQQPAAQQQFNVIDHADTVVELARPPVAPLQTSSTTDRQQQLQDSVYLLDDQHHQQQQHHHRHQSTIVFANNHQLASSNGAAGSSTFKPLFQPQSQPQSSSIAPTGSSSSSITGSAPTSQQPSGGTSDQEFTLSSSTSSASSTTPSGSSGSATSDLGGASTSSIVPLVSHSSSSMAPATSAGLSSKSSEDQQQTTPLAVQQSSISSSSISTGAQAAAMSTHVDLVSSSNTVQTTTPFTSSLSTALLPNISSHPYAPTEEPPTISQSPLVPPNQTFSPPSPSSSFPPTSLKQTVNATSTTMLQGTQTTPPASSSSPTATLGQLYSNQHSGTGSGAASSTTTSGGHDYHNELQQHHYQSAYTNRPPSSTNHQGGLMGLHPATKIVTGGSSGPNNLIPGLSGLQSAILSHIPFKIASGLSSGLSSYLQAAMKPTGNRPLISSNTAPSLQYQQQQQQQQAAAAAAAASAQIANATTGGKLPQSTQQQQQAPNGSGSFIIQNQQAASSSGAPSTVALIPNSQAGIRFPGAQSSGGQSSSPPAGTTTPEATIGSTANASQTAIVVNMNDTFTSPRNSYDVIRDAQLVCGRPQVPPPSFNLENGGKKRVARIVGGNQSLFGQWPWMVSLRQWRKGAFLHKCGAALLNENWAITAAHCVENVKASDLLLRLGEFDVSNQEEPYPFVERRVKTVVSHPSFDPKTFEYDLALLRFAEPVKYERNIVPVCVPAGNDSYVDRMATVIGWGRLYEDGPLPDVIQHVDVPIITNNECEKMYKNAGYIEEIPEMFICAGISKGGRDSCEGDSGGPLTMVDHDGRSYLVGIISWGIGCALPSQPGVYTRITAFSGWINQITAF